jgi:hypothetical protein
LFYELCKALHDQTTNLCAGNKIKMASGDIWIWFQGWGLWVLLAISLAVALYYKKRKT